MPPAIFVMLWTLVYFPSGVLFFARKFILTPFLGPKSCLRAGCVVSGNRKSFFFTGVLFCIALIEILMSFFFLFGALIDSPPPKVSPRGVETHSQFSSHPQWLNKAFFFPSFFFSSTCKMCPWPKKPTSFLRFNPPKTLEDLYFLSSLASLTSAHCGKEGGGSFGTGVGSV